MTTQELQSLKNRYDLIGNDAAFNMALETAVKVAEVDITVLISGESGTGKEQIPKIIHENSRRKHNKYFAVNCGAIPEGTMDSELFGHEKGSFTGAIETRKGYFEEADTGTLFLDEVGELPPASQAKLLRVLQSGEFIRVGSSKVRKTDVRVIAATNKNLIHAVATGKFREDLYYRLNAVHIVMPPLRERKEDIPLFFRKFSSDFSEKNRRQKVSLDREATKMLVQYRWPGNIRQLKNVAEVTSALEAPEINPTSHKRFEIGSETLRKYMPKEMGNALPAVLENKNSGLSESEKMRIYGMIRSLALEVNKLKTVVGNNMGRGERSRTTDDIQRKFNSYPVVNRFGSETSGDIFENNGYDDNRVDIQDYPTVTSNISADTTVEEPENETESETFDQTEHQNFSLKENYAMLLKQALDKHDGNRRKAAGELGISERTLYRKLAKVKDK